MANTTRTSINAIVPEVWAAEVLEELRSAQPITKYISTDADMGVTANQGDVINVTRPGAGTIRDKAAGSNYTVDAMAPTKVTLTLNKHKAYSTVFEDPATLVMNPKVRDEFIRDSARGIAEQINTDILTSVWTNLAITNYVGSGGGTGITRANIAAAGRTLSTRKVPKSDRTLILSPTDMETLVNDSSLQSYFAFAQADSVRTGQVPQLYSFVLAECQQVATNCTYPVASTRANVGLHKRGQLFASRMLPEPPPGTGAMSYAMTEEESGITVRVLMQYQSLMGGLHVVIDCLYGITELSEDRCIIVAG